LTWCPGAALSKAPLASAAALANSVEIEFDEMPREDFLSQLDEEEERKSNEFIKRRVNFAIPQAKR